MEDVTQFAARAVAQMDEPALAWVGEAETVDALLLLAADAAHGIVRPAAPIATFLAGIALGRSGGDRAALEQALADIRRAIPSA